MKATKFLVCLLLLFGSISYCLSQVIEVPVLRGAPQVYVETAPNATLFEMKNGDASRFSGTREMIDVSSMKQKKLHKPTQLEVIELTNFHRVAEYDAYYVRLKDKYYLVSSTDIADNSYLENRNRNLMLQYEKVKDSTARYSPEIAFAKIIDLADSRIKACEDSASFLRDNEESIIAERARNRAEVEGLSRLRRTNNKNLERRERYYSWVSTLPSSVQKDAKLLAIPLSGISTGYFGVCDYSMYFINTSPKTIKYLTWTGRVKNAVGDYISCEIHHTSSFSGKYTGPCGPLGYEYAVWEGVLINGSADLMVLTSVKITYTDGSSVTIGKTSLDYLANIPDEVFPSLYEYDMSIEAEEEFDVEARAKSIIEFDGSSMRYDLGREMNQQYELARLYGDAKKNLTEFKGSPSVINTFLQRGNVMRALESDKVFIEAVRGYYDTLLKYNEHHEALERYEAKYFGFLN